MLSVILSVECYALNGSIVQLFKGSFFRLLNVVSISTSAHYPIH